MTRTLLQVEAIEKQFVQVKAINHLSFEVFEGEIFALLGPNGAGKTTTVRSLMGIIRPDKGAIRYCLSNSGEAWPTAAELGYLPEERGLYKEMPVLQTLVYMGTLRGMRRTDAHDAAVQWLERLDLNERAGEKLEAFSKGNQQKIQFVSAVLHRPRFLILDEPFAGLDPVNQELFSKLIQQLRDEGTTILLSAHQMDLVERTAERLLLLNRGRAVLYGPLEEIRKRARWANQLIIRTRGVADISIFKENPAIEGLSQTTPFEVKLRVKQEASLSQLLVAAGAAMDIVDVQTERISLHEIYLQAVAGDTSTDSTD
jgi:ABC-2 type transport system ATP-binding protein